MDRTDSLDLVGTVRVDEVATLVRRVCELALFSASQFLFRVGSTHVFARRNSIRWTCTNSRLGPATNEVNKGKKREHGGTLRWSPIDFFNPRYGTTPSLRTFPRRAKITFWGCTSSPAPGRAFFSRTKLNKKRVVATS
jgi:hypothetical protein